MLKPSRIWMSLWLDVETVANMHNETGCMMHRILEYTWNLTSSPHYSQVTCTTKQPNSNWVKNSKRTEKCFEIQVSNGNGKLKIQVWIIGRYIYTVFERVTELQNYIIIYIHRGMYYMNRLRPDYSMPSNPVVSSRAVTSALIGGWKYSYIGILPDEFLFISFWFPSKVKR